MLVPDVVEYLYEIQELRVGAVLSFTLEYILNMAVLQVILGVLHIKRAQIAPDLVLGSLPVGATSEVLISIVFIEGELAVIAEMLFTRREVMVIALSLLVVVG